MFCSDQIRTLIAMATYSFVVIISGLEIISTAARLIRFLPGSEIISGLEIISTLSGVRFVSSLYSRQ